MVASNISIQKSKCFPSRARPDLLVTYRAYLIPSQEVLYNQSIEELEPCSLRRSRLAR